MCPGGWIVPASTEPDGLVVNGMSLSRRDSPFANSGLVVGVEPRDWEAAGFGGPLGGIAYQRAIERAALAAGGGAIRAPATRASDFLRKRGSTNVPETSYLPGLTATDIEPVLEAHEVVARVRRRVPCYLASNQDSYRARVMREHLRYADLLDGLFFSCDVGAAKPDPAFFAAVVDALELPADEVLFVDDVRPNVEAARAAGVTLYFTGVRHFYH